MIKKFKLYLEEFNTTIPEDEIEWINSHGEVKVTKDANGNDDKLFKASNIKQTSIKPHHGYEKGQDKKTYDAGKAKDVKEEVLSELSKKTLSSYVRKSAKQIQTATNLASKDAFSKHSKEMHDIATKRVNGVKTASYKLSEEVLSEEKLQHLKTYEKDGRKAKVEYNPSTEKYHLTHSNSKHVEGEEEHPSDHDHHRHNLGDAHEAAIAYVNKKKASKVDHTPDHKQYANEAQYTHEFRAYQKKNADGSDPKKGN